MSCDKLDFTRIVKILMILLSDLCACLSVLRNGYKVNLIHYISTLPSDTITEMIYNFQQVFSLANGELIFFNKVSNLIYFNLNVVASKNVK